MIRSVQNLVQEPPREARLDYQRTRQIAASAQCSTLGMSPVQGGSSEIKGLDKTSHIYFHLLTFPHSSSRAPPVPHFPALGK